MADASRSRLRSLFAELRRRHVLRVVLVYGLVSWIVVQVAATTFPSLGIPAWAVTLVIVIAILGFPLAVVLAWAYDTRPAEDPVGATEPVPPASPAGPAPPPSRRRDSDPIQSVAVLPFANLSTDPEQEFFSDGMAEELLDALARIDGLRVPARTSSFAFKGRAVDVREVAATLGVEAVLEGSVRKSADRIRVTAQLVSAHDGYHLWSHTYDRTLDDVFRIQEELARSIVSALSVRLQGAAKGDLVQQGTADLEAYTLVLKGRQAFARRDRESMERAIGFFEAAIERDPGYAAARSGLADVLWVGASNGQFRWTEVAERAREESRRALELAPDLAEAHATRGGVLRRDGRYEEGAAAQARAVALAPGNAQFVKWLAVSEVRLGRIEEAMRLYRRAVSLDPLSATALAGLAAHARDWYGDLETAAEWFGKALEVNPRAVHSLGSMAQVDAERGRYEEAYAWAERAREVEPESPFAIGAEAYVRALAGDREGARSLVETRLAAAPVAAAVVHMALGEPHRALERIERAAEENDDSALNILVDRAFAPLRGDPRFRAALERLAHGGLGGSA